MAKLPQGPFGPLIGKLGSIVGTTWKGIACVRSLPQKSNKPPTPLQKRNTSKFKFLNSFLRPFHLFTSVGLLNSAEGMTTTNLAYSLNHNNVSSDASGDFEFNLTQLIWSKGDLTPLQFPTLTIDTSGLMTLTWAFNYVKNMSYTDQLMLLIYCPALQITDGFIGGVNRIDKRCSFTINPIMRQSTIHIFLGLTSLDRKKTSNNQYLGTFTIL